MPIITTAVAISALKKPIEDLYSGSSGVIKKIIRKWQVAGALDQITQKIKDVEMVQTMFRHEKTALSKFYYPSRIESLRTPKGLIAQTIAINKLSDIATNKNILIVGTLGQGKSMFMRYLCVQELKEGIYIPLFLELRSLDGVTGIKDIILDELRILGLTEIDEDAFKFIMEKGALSIFLDGFDEIKREFSLRISKELSLLMADFPLTRFVISSRPGALSAFLGNKQQLQLVNLAKLNKEDLRPFLERLGHDSAHLDALLKSISMSPNSIQGVLTTPLMLTLLNETFGTSANIPDTLHYFYESMFNVLVSKHDEQKPIFKRERATLLNNLELQEAFECFSYLSKDYGVSLTEDQFSQCAKDVSLLCEKKFTAEGFKSDLTEAVCLMMQENLKLTFIHKSIQEFFAAFYLSHMKDEETVKKLYQNINKSRLANWTQELLFLEKIDNARYVKYFRIHFIEMFLNNLQFRRNSKIGVTKNNIFKFLSKISPGFISVKGDQSDWLIVNSNSDSFNPVALEVVRSINERVINLEVDEIRDIPGLSILHFTIKAYFQARPNPEMISIRKFRDACVRLDKELIRLQKIVANKSDTARSILLRSV